MTILIMAAVFVAYMTGAAVSQPKIQHFLSCLCRNCATGKPYQIRNNNGNWVNLEPGDWHNNSYGLAMIWPVVIPFVLVNSKNPKIRLASARIKGYWEDQTIDYHEKQLRELERRAFPS